MKQQYLAITSLKYVKINTAVVVSAVSSTPLIQVGEDRLSSD